jgi:hypothetical protein
MKKIVIFSAIVFSILLQYANATAGSRPRGHKYYAKHAKHHKAHKIHRTHGLIDATYQN